MSRLLVVGMMAALSFSYAPSSTAEVSLRDSYTSAQGVVIRVVVSPPSDSSSWGYVTVRQEEDSTYLNVVLLKKEYAQLFPITNHDATRLLNLMGTLFAAPRGNPDHKVRLFYLKSYIEGNGGWAYFHTKSWAETYWKE